MKTTINRRSLNGLEVLEYTSEKAEKLMFLQHGIYSNKTKVMALLAISFVKIGYRVIAVDAYKHGSRSEEPFTSKDEDLAALETMEVVKRTALDIRQLYIDYFENEYKTFDIVGISMGGLIAYYLATLTKRINTVVALISSPKFMQAAEYTFPKEKQEKYPESKEAKQLTKRMDPSTNPRQLSFKRLIMMNGVEDTVIPIEQSLKFYEDNPNLNIIFKSYETTHKITIEMHEDLISLLKEQSN